MIQFEAQADYLGRTVTVKSDNFEEMHQALAGVAELNRDFRYLAGLDGVKPAQLVPAYRVDGEGNEYFGVQDGVSGKNITFGRKREKGAVPFFPKGQDGFYDPKTGRRGQGKGQRPASSHTADSSPSTPDTRAPHVQEATGQLPF
jgi:hypothetical protein